MREPAPRPAPPGQTGAMDRSRLDHRSRLDRWNRYRFRSVWDLDAPPARVYSVLERTGDYPRWWPQVREAERTGGHSGALLIRSLLPYEIRVRARRGAGGRGTRALYEQEVEVRSPLLRRLAVPARPAFRLNHALMMRAGRHALAARLAAPPEAV
ncbi:polyketide cyclase [Streptomyces vinaceus]|uniref:Polyketide cyclase n=2 Tax=Streptomyces vinaceus TaxID=1960 RepID=A0A5J6JAQ7_STRVI|nr:polyketide cyclase [Streptomyces vinaceus]GHE49140.1 hypothetical protein GCM10017778_36150 [Streptomyces vinaceus]